MSVKVDCFADGEPEAAVLAQAASGEELLYAGFSIASIYRFIYSLSLFSDVRVY